MSSQMLASAVKEGKTQQDDMQILEEQAKKMAEESKKDQQKSKGVKTMSFVK